MGTFEVGINILYYTRYGPHVFEEYGSQGVERDGLYMVVPKSGTI